MLGNDSLRRIIVNSFLTPQSDTNSAAYFIMSVNT